MPDPSKHDQAAAKRGPFVFAAVRLEGVDPSSPSLYLSGLLVEMVGALLMTWLLLALPDLTYGARVKVVVRAALVAGALGHLPNWHWWGFSTGFTLVSILDLVIGYFFAGLVLAKIVGDR